MIGTKPLPDTDTLLRNPSDTAEAIMRVFVTIIRDVFFCAVLYALAWVLWVIGLYLNIMPMPRMISPIEANTLPPLLLPLVFIAWRIAAIFAPPSPSNRRARRVGALAVAAITAVILEGIHSVYPEIAGDSSGHGNAFGARAVLVLMFAVSVYTLIRDRDPRTALLFIACALLSIVPLVVTGRTIAGMITSALDALVRGAHIGFLIVPGKPLVERIACADIV